MSRLIVLEGPDGVGKTSIATALAERLTEKGEQSQYLSFPGREPGTLGEWVYNVHHNNDRDFQLPFMSLQMLHVASHLDIVENRISTLLNEGVSVILDRYWWSTWVYGMAQAETAVQRQIIRNLCSIEKAFWLDCGVQPYAVIYLYRMTPLREENLSLWNKLCDEYVNLMREETMRGKRTKHWAVPNDTSLQNTLGYLEAMLGMEGEQLLWNLEEASAK